MKNYISILNIDILKKHLIQGKYLVKKKYLIKLAFVYALDISSINILKKKLAGFQTNTTYYKTHTHTPYFVTKYIWNP